LNIPLDSYETLMKYIGALHSYIRHTLLLFNPTSLDEVCVQATHLENMGKHVQEDPMKKPSSFPDLGGYRWPPTFSNWLKTIF
jgi:hypothetical protein